MRVNVGEARDRLSELVQTVLDGGQVTICKHGTPVVDLVRTRRARREPPQLGALAGMGVIADPDWHKGPETEAELVAWLEGRFE